MSGAYALFDAGGASLGLLLGGVLARTFGITTPFWLACAAMTLVTVAAWAPLRDHVQPPVKSVGACRRDEERIIDEP